MAKTGRVQNVITKDDIVFLFRGCQEIEDKVLKNALPFEQVINAFKVLVTQVSDGKFFCPECGAEWLCIENRCTAQCNISRHFDKP